jgi:hypothetical protein
MKNTLPPDVEQLIEQLTSPDFGQRIAAAAGLAVLDCRDESVRGALEDIARNDPDVFVLEEARYALGKLGFPKPEPAAKSLWEPEVAPDPEIPAAATTGEPYQAPAIYDVNEPIPGAVRSMEESRREKRWLLGLGIPMLLVVITCAGLFLFYLQKSLAEVPAMGPWPGVNVDPDYLVNLNLSAFGLESARIMDARDIPWSENLSYQKGSYREYRRGQVPIVAIWALRYSGRQAANSDYSAMEAWTKEAGGSYRSAYLNNVGIIHLGFSDYYSKMFWNDRWIVVIDAAAGTEYDPPVLVDKVRDVMAAHWRPE